MVLEKLSKLSKDWRQLEKDLASQHRDVCREIQKSDTESFNLDPDSREKQSKSRDWRELDDIKNKMAPTIDRARENRDKQWVKNDFNCAP